MSQRLGVDIDGVIADQTEAMVNYLSSKYDMSFSVSDLRRGSSYISAIGSDYTTEMRAAQSENEYYPNMPAVSGAIDALHALDEQYEIVLVTHRPKKKEKVTRNWLDEHDVPYDELRLGAPDDKSAIGIDFLIDDRVGNVTECAHAVSMLFLRGHNLNRLPSDVWMPSDKAQSSPETLARNPSKQWEVITSLLTEEPAPAAVIRSSLL